MPGVEFNAVDLDDALLLPLGTVDFLDVRIGMATTAIDIALVVKLELEAGGFREPRTDDQRHEERQKRKAILRLRFLRLERLEIKAGRRVTALNRLVERRRRRCRIPNETVIPEPAAQADHQQRHKQMPPCIFSVKLQFHLSPFSSTNYQLPTLNAVASGSRTSQLPPRRLRSGTQTRLASEERR